MAKNVILTSARQNHPDGNSCNFVCVSRISGNSSCHPAPCIELLEYNGIHGMAFFLTKKLMPKCTHATIASQRPQYVGAHALVFIYNAWAKHYPVTRVDGILYSEFL